MSNFLLYFAIGLGVGSLLAVLCSLKRVVQQTFRDVD